MVVLHVLVVALDVLDNVALALREDLVKIIVLRDVLLHAGSALDVQVVVWEVVVLAVLVLVVVILVAMDVQGVVDVILVLVVIVSVLVAVALVVGDAQIHVLVLVLDSLLLVKFVLDHVLRGVLAVVPVTLPVLQTALLLAVPHAQELVLEQLSLHDLAAF